ncbi:hypothetical protein AVL61_07770 [Kocuria rosea subsp. polaris]|uniref:Polysaccharide biosynthesis protein C-terminal domain-containing protein n=1 Tax=Kocuria rosea subsp. polaris TaxID=136273 RepID=A0A0W8IN37_KOCRO|nr:hypothetical protein AVL61_07770 [Kocuria polaris]
MFRRVIMQFSVVVAGRLFAALAQAVTIVLLARWSAPEDFGLVIAVQTVLVALTVVLSVGMPQYIGVLRARDPASATVDAMFNWSRLTSVIAAASCLIVFVILGFFDSAFLVFSPLALALGLQRHSAVWDSIAVADGQVALFSSNLVIRRVIALLCFFSLHLADVDVALAYCTAVFISEIAYNLRMKRVCVFTPVTAARADMRPVFKESRHFWVDAMSGHLRLLDVAAVGLVLGPLASGFVAVPSRIASPLMMLPSSFATLILPRVSAGRGHTARQGLVLAGGVTTLIALLLAAVTPFLDEIVLVLLGGDYLPAVEVTRIYFIGFIGLSLLYMLGAVLQGVGLYSAVGRNSVFFSVLSIGLLCAGGYFYGLEAAAWGYVIGTIGQVSGLVYLYLFRFRGTGSHIDDNTSARSLARRGTTYGEHRR